MPWAPPTEPSLGLGILKSCLGKSGFPSKVFHASSWLLHWVSIETYEWISECWGINEFLFSGLLDPRLDKHQLDYLGEKAGSLAQEGRMEKYPNRQSIIDLILTLRSEVIPRYLNFCADKIMESRPLMVGFTCMFDQTIASLALSKHLKERDPAVRIAFGGYALTGSTGQTVSKSFPWVDIVCDGEGEEAIVCLAREMSNCSNKNLNSGLKIIFPKRINVEDSPAPDYSDWFKELDTIREEAKIEIRTKTLGVESSRGCWWGQHKHCVFCGIDDETLKYRFKSSNTTLKMLRDLRAEYGDHVFRFSDYIMPKFYYGELLPRLAAEEPKFRLHAEIKANQPFERVKLLADAGFAEVQPGVESFSTRVLKSMDKGVRSIDNVCLLKCAYLNHIIIDYNLLYGLPNDDVQDYYTMAANIPRLYHLIPPVSRTRTVVTKFAPLQVNPERFGIASAAKHHKCYNVIFSEDFLYETGFSLDDYAYYFERNFEYSAELSSIYHAIVKQVDHWKSLHRTRFVELSIAENSAGACVIDSRYSNERYSINELQLAILKSSDLKPVSLARLASAISLEHPDISFKMVEDAISELDERRLIWQDQGFILSLVVPKAISDDREKTSWNKKWFSIYV